MTPTHAAKDAMNDAPRLDTANAVETPEGVELALRVAGPVPRCLAWLLDACIRVVIYILVAMIAGAFGTGGGGLFLLALFAVEWFYPVAFELLNHGATPGKRVLGLRAIRDDGGPLAWTDSVIRNFMRTVDFLPMGYALGIVCMLTHRDFKRVGDLAAGTLVVYTDAADLPPVLPEIQPIAPPAVLLPHEQKTLIDFAERMPRITPERATELARAAGPLIDDAEDPAARLSAYAGWVAGQR